MALVRATVAVTAPLTLAMLLTAAPASASFADSSGEVLVSSDGVRFDRTVDALFDTEQVLVPGGSSSATVWIRNDSHVAAAMRMSMRELTVSSDEFAGALVLAVTDPAGSTRESSLAAWGDCAVLASSPTVQPGQTMQVDLGLAMADVDGLTAQGHTADLTMVVAMRDGEAGAFPASACQDDGVTISTGKTDAGRQQMARTGADLPIPLFAAGGALIGTGFFFAFAGRRRRSR